MLIKSSQLSIELNEKGTISSIKNKRGVELISYTLNRSLFSLFLLDESKNRVIVNSNNSSSYSYNKNADEYLLFFTRVGNLDINAEVRIKVLDNLSYWRIKVVNNTALTLDKVEFPTVYVKNDLVATGGSGYFFTPMMEGAIVEDALSRNRTYMKYVEDSGYPARGWSGLYPGATQMQFMAHYNNEGGLYFAAHDPYCSPKEVEYNGLEDEIKMEIQLFGDTTTNTYEYDFDMVLGTFDGDWYDAASIYRDFILNCGIIKLPKLKNNNALPKWFKESPIVTCYPVRGEVDSHFEETTEYYPYTKALPYIESLNKDLDSKIMPLLMHWEGTCPWAPPYVWPPYGDKNDFDEYIKALHDSGNYFGLYCSGIAWTQESTLIKAYNKREDFIKLGIDKVVVKSPKQEINDSFVCGGVGYRHDMCPACDLTVDIATAELEKIVANCNPDYIQFFDQMCGGGCYPCYATDHGHKPGPGRWQNEAMLNLNQKMRDVLAKYNRLDRVLIGCEANAAEPYINDYVFNDSRHNICYWFADPVPAYNFVFHEYVSNFMGNQNTCYGVIDFKKYPNNVYHRFAHSFVQGDFLTIVLKDKGKIHWDWCTPWNEKEINQDEIKAYIRNLNAWRKGYAKEALQFGKMIKPLAFKCDSYTEISTYKTVHNYSSISSCAYELDNGVKQQIFVNYLDNDQTILINVPNGSKLVKDHFGENITNISGSNSITIKAREVILIEYK